MRTIAALALLLAAAVGSPGSIVAAEASPQPLAPASPDPAAAVNPVCLQAFALAAVATAATSAVATYPSASADPATTGVDDHLDDTIRACASLDEWQVAALLSPGAVGGIEPLLLLQDRCGDPVSGLGAYATCRSIELASAEAEPEASPPPSPPAAPTTGPTGTNVAAPLRADGQVRLPKQLRAKVPGATEIRYFNVFGRSAPVLVKQTLRRAAAFCGVHDALACVDLTWRVQTSLTRSASSCTVSNASSTVTSVVYLPRWSGPSRVDAELLQWWRRVLSDSAKHEAQHIRILQAELVRLRDVLVARPCASIDRLIDRSKRRSTRAQAAFDRRESTKPLPPMP